MKRVFRTVVPALVLACAVSAASAAAPSWSYVEAGYLNISPDDIDGFNVDSGDNWFAGANFQIGNMFHVGARYVDGDFGEIDNGVGGTEKLDFTYWTFVAGWHGALGENADLFAEAAWNDVEVGDDSDGFNDDAVGINAGAKWRPVDLFEVDGTVKWADYEDSTTNYEVKGIFYFGRFSVGALVEFSDDYSQYGVFGRWNFGAK